MRKNSQKKLRRYIQGGEEQEYEEKSSQQENIQKQIRLILLPIFMLYTQMLNKEASKKADRVDKLKDYKLETHLLKEDSNNPYPVHLFELSPLSPLLRTVKKSYQFSSPICDLAMINTPLVANKQRSLIEEVDEGSHQKISMVLGFEEANEVDEVDEYSSEFESEQFESSEVDQQTIRMEEKVEIEKKNEEDVIEQEPKFTMAQQEKIKLSQKIQKRKQKQPAIITRKVSCNCKKTKCLKLYCDCFQEGQYCDENCNCSGCHNTQQYESERNTSILSLLDRNPEAFKPKVEAEQHSKGCNCKKSGCLKKYCECYQAGLVCGENCKCEDCKNCGDKYKNRRFLEQQASLKLN